MPLPALNFLRSNATPTLILCFAGACFPLPPCGHHCPSPGIISISLYIYSSAPSFHPGSHVLSPGPDDLYSQSGTMHRSLPLLSLCRCPPAGPRHTLRVWQPWEWEWARHLLKAIHPSCGELAKFKNLKTKLLSPEKETGKASSHQCRHKYCRFPFLGKCCFIPTVSEYRSNQAHDPVYLFWGFFLSNIIIPFNMIQLIITCY